MNNNLFVKKFSVDLTNLSINEREVVKKLEEAVIITAKIYASQVNDKNPGANFYPSGLPKKTFENPRLLSPFSIIKRDKTNGLTAIPYHKYYQDDLNKISKILTEAALISKNTEFSRYLRTCGQALLTGEYPKMDISWLKLTNSSLDFQIGPFERYLDRLFFLKRSYQAHIGIKNEKETAKAERIKDILYTKVKGDLGKIHQVVPPEKIKIVVDDNFLFGGLAAHVLFSEEHFPCDLETSEKFGSRILIYLSSIKLKFDTLTYPIFENIFEKKFQKTYSRDLLFRGNFYYIILSSLARQLHRYKNSRERLKELFPIIDEPTASASGIKYCKHLIMEGVMGQRELEAIIIAHICWIFTEWIYAKTSKTRIDYLKGDALSLGFYLKEGALEEKNGIFWPDFSRIFFTIENLANTFVDILSQKSYNEAQKFLEEYLTFKYFQRFDKKLTSINCP